MTDDKDWNDTLREQGAEGARETFNESIANAEREQGNSGPPPGDDDGEAASKIPVLRSYFIEELEKRPVVPVEWRRGLHPRQYAHWIFR